MKTPVSFLVILRFVLAATFATSVMAQASTNKITSALNPATASSANDNHDSIQPPSPAPQFSHWTAKIVRLIQSGVDDQVVLAFINSAGTFNLTAADILHLNDLGVSSQVVHAMLTHDRDRFVRLDQSTNVANISPSHRPASRIASPDKSPENETPNAPALVTLPLAQSIDMANDDPAIQSFDTPIVAQAVTLPETATPTRDSLTWEKSPRLPAGPTKKNIVYPVRAPYPVELTAPIVMLEYPSF